MLHVAYAVRRTAMKTHLQHYENTSPTLFCSVSLLCVDLSEFQLQVSGYNRAPGYQCGPGDTERQRPASQLGGQQQRLHSASIGQRQRRRLPGGDGHQAQGPPGVRPRPHDGCPIKCLFSAAQTPHHTYPNHILCLAISFPLQTEAWRRTRSSQNLCSWRL